jgi:hypothetical protein
MVRVFYIQKTEQLIEKLELTQWQNHLQKKINLGNQESSDNKKMCALDEIIKIKSCQLYGKFIL